MGRISASLGGGMQRNAPHVSRASEIGFEEDIIQGLIQDNIDIGVMYTGESSFTGHRLSVW